MVASVLFYGSPAPGFPALATLVSFLTGMNLFVTGVVGAFAAFVSGSPRLREEGAALTARVSAGEKAELETVRQALSHSAGLWDVRNLIEDGFTDSQVRPYTFNPAPFLADPTAVQQGYLTSEPYSIEQAAGFEPRVYLQADEGYPSNAAMDLAPNAFARDNEDTVRTFAVAGADGLAMPTSVASVPAAAGLEAVGWTSRRLGLPYIGAVGLRDLHPRVRRALRPRLDIKTLRRRLTGCVKPGPPAVRKYTR